MKKTWSFLLVCLMLVTLLVPCSMGTYAAAGKDEIVNGRFVKTKSITVEIFDRGNAGGSKPEANFYTDFIKEGLLRDHNIEVKFVPVPRWTEVEVLNNLLAAGDAPDVCYTYSYPTIQTYANMGGVLDMSSYLEEYKELLPNLWGFVGKENIYWNKDPVKGTIWAIEARLFQNKRINTFVREDWLKKLGLAEPTTLKEFEDMLITFRDNAEVLLGADANKMIPFGISFDVGWRANHLLVSSIAESISDKDRYVYGFDDRHLLLPGVKEGVRKLNEWYNAGLVWKDFPLYGPGDSTEDNFMKAGYVGAFMHNWDYPFRDGEDSIHNNLKRLVGEEAAYIAVECFQNDAGLYRKYLSAPVDRKIFFPASNKEPLAALLYLNWITKFENRKFLQIGEEGVTHEVQADGSVKILPATGEKIMNSPQNIDYTMTINGLDLGDPELTARSIAFNYPGVDKRFVETAYQLTSNEARYGINVNVGEIKAEEGMAQALKEKRDNLWIQAVVAKPDEFDAVYDRLFEDYLRSGGQAIINERKAAYEKYYED